MQSFRLLLLVLVCASPATAADPAARARELPYLRCIMPESLTEYAHVEVPGIENIAIKGNGDDAYLGLHLYPGQKKLHGGIRAEVSVDYPYTAGETVRYAWRLMVPKGFISDAPKNRWWIVGQWHDQPDVGRGETWEGFASRSPPVLLGLGEMNGRIGIGIAYGLNQDQKFGPLYLESDKWHSVTVEIRWSRKGDGTASFFLDDMSKPAAVAKGPNMHNDWQHYLKIGMYRHPEIQTDNWLYVDNLEITKVSAEAR